MKFTRRAEGIKECRAIFRKSREDKRSQYHVSTILSLFFISFIQIFELILLNILQI